MSRELVRTATEQRSIPWLIHFTRCKNLSSILKHGICSVDHLNTVGLKTVTNDQYRLDGHLNAACLSIGFPNYKMFYRLRKENPDEDWAVLKVKSEVLWKADCGFCRHNAADAKVTALPLDMRKTPAAFNGLFEEIEGLRSRSEAKLKQYDPTDPQAEVLVFDAIGPEDVLEVIFESTGDRDKYAAVTVNFQTKVIPNYFSARWYVRGGISDG
jgi:hypothetical protein